jgi:hypothetical protein
LEVSYFRDGHWVSSTQVCGIGCDEKTQVAAGTGKLEVFELHLKITSIRLNPKTRDSVPDLWQTDAIFSTRNKIWEEAPCDHCFKTPMNSRRKAKRKRSLMMLATTMPTLPVKQRCLAFPSHCEEAAEYCDDLQCTEEANATARTGIKDGSEFSTDEDNVIDVLKELLITASPILMQCGNVFG